MHWPQHPFLYSFFYQGAPPYFIPDAPVRLTCEPPLYPMVKGLQLLHHCPQDHPDLAILQQHCIYERPVQNLLIPHRRPRLLQHPQQHAPLPPTLLSGFDTGTPNFYCYKK